METAFLVGFAVVSGASALLKVGLALFRLP